MENLISEKQCRKILAKVSPRFILESYEVKKLEQESMGGLIGLHYKLYLQYKENNKKEEIQFFLKTLNRRSTTMYRVSTDLRMFKKESLFYMSFLPLFRDKGIDVSFAPRGYLCENDCVVIEDLSLSKFKLYPKSESLDLEHCYGCLTALAKFHMSSILYEIYTSEDLGTKYSFLDEHPDLKNLAFSQDDNYGALLMEKAVLGILDVAKLEFVEKGEFHDFENKLNTILSNQDENSKFRKCLLHGDLWSNNFLHKYEKNKLVESKLIDFQLLNYGPPSSDVLHFIYSNTRRKFRDEYFDTLLTYYYKKLKEFYMIRAYLSKKFFQKRNILNPVKS
ncbi:hypothetical protein WA026_017106 [Henosepilachna vigintioctopunctata]|uniref:CHK kinase-like domain-containing protein n=1 Tax=Henosepilachna vigintioctopunctata TaxID=420089 RepID=A0AAW1TPQ7_9CUCU